MDNDIDYRRIITLSLCALISTATFFIPEHLLTNTDIYTDLLTTISILCGVLIAAISILGATPSKISSQATILYEQSTESKMLRLRIQFHLYLLVISAALACKLLNGDDSSYSIYIYRITVFIGAFALLTSFNLPRLLSGAFKHTQIK